jgi:hypothetical protein
MPTTVDGRFHPRRILGRPDDQVRGSRRNQLLAARTAVGLPGTLPRHHSHPEFAVGGLLSFPSAQRRTDGAASATISARATWPFPVVIALAA